MKKLHILVLLVLSTFVSHAQFSIGGQGFYNTPKKYGRWSAGGEIGIPIAGKLYAQLGVENSFEVTDTTEPEYYAQHMYSCKYLGYYGGFRYYLGENAHAGRGFFVAFSAGMSSLTRWDSTVNSNLQGESYWEVIKTDEPNQSVFYMNYELGYDLMIARGVYITPRVRFRRSVKGTIKREYWARPYDVELKSERYFNHWGFGLGLYFDLSTGSFLGKARYENRGTGFKTYGDFNPWRRR